jgi:hypothetical protein
VQRLLEIQAHFRDAVIDGDTNGISHVLIGGSLPERRLTIHQRNYHSSLTDAVLTKFPATEWLLGTQFLTTAVSRFIRQRPPRVPCIAEYGSDFPDFLGQRASDLPYVRDFANFEWFVGKAAISVDQRSVDNTAISDIDSLSGKLVVLQTGVYYLHASWAVDELMTMYLTGSAPSRYELTQADVWVEVRGVRGEFQWNRLTKEDFMFRQSLSQGLSIGEAAERALDINADFDPGCALGSILTEGLVTAVRQNNEEQTDGRS